MDNEMKAILDETADMVAQAWLLEQCMIDALMRTDRSATTKVELADYLLEQLRASLPKGIMTSQIRCRKFIETRMEMAGVYEKMLTREQIDQMDEEMAIWDEMAKVELCHYETVNVLDEN